MTDPTSSPAQVAQPVATQSTEAQAPAIAGAAGDALRRGVELRSAGNLDGAIAAYREAARIDPTHPAPFFNIGNVLFDQGQWGEAREAFAEAAKRQPGFAGAWLQVARCEVKLGQLREARESFASALRLEPTLFSAWLEAGNLCRTMGIAQQALISYRRAVESAPDRWEGRLSLARQLEDSGQWDEAAGHYHLALGAASGKAGGVRDVHRMMARYRLERGDAARALESLRQALGIVRVEKPEADINLRADLQIDLGEVLMRLGLTDPAHRAFERASSATDEFVLARLAQVSFHNNLWQEAQEVLKRCVELHPASATALWNLAHSYAESWMMEEAEATLRKAESIAPQPGAASMRASIAGRIGDADSALAIYRQLGEQEGPESAMRSSAAMASLYSDSLDAREVSDLHRELFSALGEGARTPASFANTRDPERRIRLGFISADLHHQHPVNIFMQPVLARIDRSRFEVFMYHTGIAHDDQTQLARTRVDHWVASTAFSSTQLARRIESDQIDMVIDLSGHTSLNRVPMLAKRTAPVQITFLGYPGSTGVPNIDWIIADPVVAPEGSDVLFSERVMRLPHAVFCYAPEVNYPFPDYGRAHRDRPLTFGSFNNVPKLTPHTIRLWARVLKAIPEARLVLKAPSFKDHMAIGAFRERFEREGIEGTRIDFRGPVGLTDMMAEYADIDIALDPVPYNGGTTTLQALWMGVPVLAKAGAGFVSRMGASFMTSAGLGDWVASDDDHYVELAVRKARDRDALLALKRGLRERLKAAPAWDIDRYVRDLEAALREMWRAHCESPQSTAPALPKSGAKASRVPRTSKR